MELYILYDAAARILAARGVAICRSLIGNYVTSLEMAGESVTLTRLSTPLLALWDAQVRHRPEVAVVFPGCLEGSPSLGKSAAPGVHARSLQRSVAQ